MRGWCVGRVAGEFGLAAGAVARGAGSNGRSQKCGQHESQDQAQDMNVLNFERFKWVESAVWPAFAARGRRHPRNFSLKKRDL